MRGSAGFRTAGPAADELLLPDDAVAPNPEPVGAAAAAAAVPDELIVAQVWVLQRWLASARVRRIGLGAAGLGRGTATVAAAAVGVWPTSALGTQNSIECICMESDGT